MQARCGYDINDQQSVIQLCDCIWFEFFFSKIFLEVDENLVLDLKVFILFQFLFWFLNIYMIWWKKIV